MQLLVSEEHTARLVTLFRYERARREPLAVAYYANACMLLQDESVYRFTVEDPLPGATVLDAPVAVAAGGEQAPVTNGDAAVAAAVKEEGGGAVESQTTRDLPLRMAITLFDQGPEMPAAAMETNFAEYSKRYLRAAHAPGWDTCAAEGENHVFLRKNVLSGPWASAAAGPPKATTLGASSPSISALEGATVINGLECRISAKDSKLTYVDSTSDLFIRHRKRKRSDESHPADEAREKRMAAWLEQRLVEITGAS